jgi:hypothetical protein
MSAADQRDRLDLDGIDQDAAHAMLCVPDGPAGRAVAAVPRLTAELRLTQAALDEFTAALCDHYEYLLARLPASARVCARLAELSVLEGGRS